jgi:hypothetical protein
VASRFSLISGWPHENAFNTGSFFKVSISKEPAQTGSDFPVLQNTYTQDEAGQRYCPLSMAGDRTFCFGSGCMAFVWLPDQRDARIARGYCGIANRAPH